MYTFQKWLKIFLPNSLDNYSSGINKIDEILKDLNFDGIENLNLENYNQLRNKIIETEKFIKFNNSNNIGTATLSNYYKFLETNDQYFKLNIDEIKWSWTTGTPTNGYNSPFILCEVVKLFNKFNRGKELNKELLKLEDVIVLRNKFNAEKDASLVLSQDRDVLTQFGQYWKFFNLTKIDSRDVQLTDFGKKVALEVITIDEFIKYQIEHVSQKTRISNIKSLNLILEILNNLYIKDKTEAYLRVEELINIIPFIYIEIFTLKQLTSAILYFRKVDPKSIDLGILSKLTSNEFRFVEQHFLFLFYSERLNFINDSGQKKYYLINNDIINEKHEIETQFEKDEKLLTSIAELFLKSSNNCGLIFSRNLIKRFIASLCTKQFLILTGLSGSGKTKLAQAFANWIAESKEQYLLVPVGADWTNREPLLGYPNSLEPKKYVTPESGVIQIIKKSLENPEKPYFLILDEMNLSHVERYFADFLSAMESKESIKLYSDSIRYSKFDDNNDPIKDSEVFDNFKLPSNLFIIGTVNIDETTYMFSPKVLDRANTIEFRLTEEDLDLFFQNTNSVNLNNLHEDGDESKPGLGNKQSEIFIDRVYKAYDNVDYSRINNVLKTFFTNLKAAGAEFGYRTANEIGRLIDNLEYFGSDLNESIDYAVMQKLLPKLHGSRSKMIRVLPILANSCLTDNSSKTFLDEFVKGTDVFNIHRDIIKYPVSLDKICRMYKNALDNGFTSYAEA